MEIPPDFARRVRESLGDAGEAWLRDLPALVGELSQRWNVALGPPFELSYNYVASARRADGTDAVFKIGPWEDGEIAREIDALRLYGGDGACRLLESDQAHRAMLLERLHPGDTLLGVAARNDDAATRIGADVMRRLWRPVESLPDPQRFKSLAEWFTAAFERHRAEYGGPGPFPAAVLEHAKALVPDLLASAPTPVLLHGDFHHYNILSSDRAPWLAIDPKGMLGDPGYEIGPFLLNPDMDGPPKEPDMLRRRLEILAVELGYDQARLRDWGTAHAVLSACWSAENGGSGWQSAIAAAENLIGL